MRKRREEAKTKLIEADWSQAERSESR